MIIEIDTSVDSKDKLKLVAKLLLDLANKEDTSSTIDSLNLKTPSNKLESENINKIREFISTSEPDLNIMSHNLDDSGSGIDSKVYNTSNSDSDVNFDNDVVVKDNPLSQVIPKDMADEIVAHTDDVLTEDIVNEPQDSNVLEKIANPKNPILPLNEPKFDLDKLYDSIAKLSKFYTPSSIPSFKTKQDSIKEDNNSNLGDNIENDSVLDLSNTNSVIIEEVYDVSDDSNNDDEQLTEYFEN